MPFPGVRRGISGITLFLLLCLGGLAGCAVPPAATPTSAPVAELAPTEPVRTSATVAPTWTRPARPEAESTPARELAATPRPTRTPVRLPTSTPFLPAEPAMTPTAAATATATPMPTATLTATPPAPPAGRPNLLPNPSFEEGWYHPGGIDELQIPNRWTFEWEEGTNHLDPDPWNGWVRPEVRVLSPEFLPPQEHATFIWDGKQTLKVFKGSGAISFRLKTTVYLEPGAYLFVIRVFPDLVDAYLDGGQKVWAPDYLSGEVAFIVDGDQQPWQFPRFGQKNEYQQLITIGEARLVELGGAMRGRWAITNNGWFLDDWALYPVETAQPGGG